MQWNKIGCLCYIENNHSVGRERKLFLRINKKFWNINWPKNYCSGITLWRQFLVFRKHYFFYLLGWVQGSGKHLKSWWEVRCELGQHCDTLGATVKEYGSREKVRATWCASRALPVFNNKLSRKEKHSPLLSFYLRIKYSSLHLWFFRFSWRGFLFFLLAPGTWPCSRGHALNGVALNISHQMLQTTSLVCDYLLIYNKSLGIKRWQTF